MSTEQKYHWFLVAGRSMEGTHNKPFGLGSKNITKTRLEWFKQGMTEQATERGFQCRNLVITSVSYLGEMTEAEFVGGDQ